MADVRRMINANQAAQALGISKSKFYRDLPAMKATGFPAPVPGIELYDPAAIAAWQNKFLAAGAAPAAEAVAEAEAVAAKARMRERARNLAA